MAATDPINMEDLWAKYPDWNIVDAVRDPKSGGIWALGADGGVFALDGAPFFGSYWDIPAAGRQGERSFVRIEVNAANGGYRLVSDRPGEIYEEQFGDPNFVPGSDVTTGNPPPGKEPPPKVDASKVGITGLLTSMNLTGLVDKAWQFWTDMGATATMDAVNVWIRQQPEFAARFPAMKWLESQGKYWTPAQYISYQTGVQDVMRSAGIPANFWDDDQDISTLIQNNWSLDEVTDAVGQAEHAVLNLPPAVMSQLKTWGLSTGDAVAFWLNPDKGMTMAERKVATQQATIGAATTPTTGALTQKEAERLRRNVGVEAATTGLEKMGQLAPLFSETAEERTDLGRKTALSAVGGTTAERVAAGGQIERRRQSRVARFEGGGGAAGGGAGQTGLGTAR